MVKKLWLDGVTSYEALCGTTIEQCHVKGSNFARGPLIKRRDFVEYQFRSVSGHGIAKTAKGEFGPVHYPMLFRNA